MWRHGSHLGENETDGHPTWPPLFSVSFSYNQICLSTHFFTSHSHVFISCFHFHSQPLQMSMPANRKRIVRLNCANVMFKQPNAYRKPRSTENSFSMTEQSARKRREEESRIIIFTRVSFDLKLRSSLRHMPWSCQDV